MSMQDTVKPVLSMSGGVGGGGGGGRKRSGSMTDDNINNTTPTTPRPNARFADQPVKDSIYEESSFNTPTRRDFPGVRDQRLLPGETFASSNMVDAPGEPKPNQLLVREESRRSINSTQSNDSGDVDMADDDEGQDDGSDNDSVASDSQPPSKKKKKGQRFYCTDFPPCQLSFTRSEHLARHIRKHTGERPFQCHCSRRFSRLDNLRQHAQTVHVNEEIPGDSLAATGTRFQRQIRTDRVRPPNARPRASTASSQGGGHSRGHSRNLSASSITSTASSVGMFEDSRPRPPPLVISQDGAARARLSLDSFNPAIGNAGTQYGVFQQQPQSGYSTPTSATFSAGASSPQFSSGMPSPNSSLSRSSFYNGTRTPSRRLSVPGGAAPYQPSGQSGYPPTYFSPMPSSTASAFSNNNHSMASPTSSVFSHTRHDSDAEIDWRRRTWHSGTHSSYTPRPATSGLSYHQTPDDAAPAMSSQPAASQITRLPGIESFDHAPPPPGAPARSVTSPTLTERQGLPLSYTSVGDPPGTGPDDRRPSSAWEAGLQQNLTRLDLGNTAGSRVSWGEQSRAYSSARPTTAPQSGHSLINGHFMAPPPLQPPVEIKQGMAGPPANDGAQRSSKRQAWYGGPLASTQGSQPILIAHRTSPESSSSEGVPTPSTSHGRELHPAIRHANGMIDMQPPGSVLSEDQRMMMQAHYQQQQEQQNKPEPMRADSAFHGYAPATHGQMAPMYVMHSGYDMQVHHGYTQATTRPSNDMGRLEALVAVATSENRAVEHRS